jgi:hypothetical protein
MSFVLFVLGLVASAAGVLMVGFGIPINEFSLGNTLIMAGTTALAGGLIVLGLAVISRQLGKIADLLGRADRPVEIHEAAPASRMAPRPAPSPEPPARAPSFPERPFTPAPMDMSDDPDFEPVRLDRPGGAQRIPPAPSEFEPIEDVPLSPRTQPRIPGIGAAPPPSEPGCRTTRLASTRLASAASTDRASDPARTADRHARAAATAGAGSSLRHDLAARTPSRQDRTAA